MAKGAGPLAKTAGITNSAKYEDILAPNLFAERLTLKIMQQSGIQALTVFMASLFCRLTGPTAFMLADDKKRLASKSLNGVKA